MDTGELLLLHKKILSSIKNIYLSYKDLQGFFNHSLKLKIVTILLPPSLIFTMLSQKVFLKKIMQLCLHTDGQAVIFWGSRSDLFCSRVNIVQANPIFFAPG